MNRQAYLAELAQLLYYMTAWDRDAALAKYTKLFEERDNDFAVIQELGSPMKLAVTLSRSYEASPEPAEDAAEQESPAPAEETPAEVPEAVSAETSPEPAQTTEETPEPAKEESTESPAEKSAEPVSEPETQPEQPVEETPAEPIAQPEAVPDAPVQPEPAKRAQVRDEIFSEIFEAATQAQSAVVVPEKDESPIVRKSRPGFLILYALLCIVVGIPVTVFLLAVDLVIFCLAVASFGVGIYVVLFLVDPRFSILGDKLVIIGITILCFTVAVAICSLAVWFLRNAVVAFIRMLIRFGRKHGYKEEDCP